MTRSELGQCGEVWEWEQDLRWVDVGGLGVEDRIRFYVGNEFLGEEDVERGYGFLVGVWGDDAIG